MSSNVNSPRGQSLAKLSGSKAGAQIALRKSHLKRETSSVATAYENFQAHAFHPDLPDPLEGTMFFTAWAVTFQSGDMSIEIPLQQLLTDFDSAGDGRVILRDSSDSGWTLVTSDMDVLELRSIPQLVQLAERVQAQLTRRELVRRAKIALIFFAASGLALWMGMLAIGAMVRSIVARVPPHVEKQVGDDALAELKSDLQLSTDTNQVARLTAAAQPLLSVLPAEQPWQFHIINDDSLNAFALPGGHILVTTGLLHRVQRPEELLGVLAHEVAHVTHKHGFRRQISSAGPLLVFQIFLRGRSGTMAVLAGGSALLVTQSFSQEYEQEADDVGWKYLLAANIDPSGMTDVFRKLKAAEAAEKHLSFLPKAFESHPDIDKRIARLEAKWKRLPRKSGFVQLNARDAHQPRR